jgi:hypothetical protein
MTKPAPALNIPRWHHPVDYQIAYALNMHGATLPRTGGEGFERAWSAGNPIDGIYPTTHLDCILKLR